MLRYASINKIAQTLDVGVMALNRTALKADLKVDSKYRGAARKLSFEQSLALVLTYRCEQLCDFSFDALVLFESFYQKTRAHGSGIAAKVISINQNRRTLSLDTRDDIKGVVEMGGSILTGTWTFMAIQPFYQKLALLFGMVEIPDAEVVRAK